MLNKFSFVFILAIFFAAVAAPAGAVGKITVDPNTSTSAKAESESSVEQNSDVRLSQTVTYDARRKTVLAILSDLSEKTGITLIAGWNTQDWQVRDRKMNVFAKDVPLANLMSSIARVMKFKWMRRGEEGDWSYRLYMDRRALLDAETQRLRQEHLFAQRQDKQREKMFSDLAKMGELSPEELSRLKTDAPLMYIFATTGMGSALGAFLAEVPVARDALATGQGLEFGGSYLSPAAQQSLIRMLQGVCKLTAMVTGKEETLPDEVVQNIGKVRVQLNRQMEEARGSAVERLLLGDISLYYKGGAADEEGINMTQLGLPNPSGEVANIAGKALLDAYESGVPFTTHIDLDTSEKIAQAVTAEIEAAGCGEPVVEHPDDPDLHAKLKLQLKSNDLEEAEAALAESSGLTIVSDSFGKTECITKLQAEEMELKEILEKIAQSCRYNWEKHGAVIEFRDRDWYSKRSAQIPEAWIESWRGTLKKTGTLDLAELARIAMLTQEQFNINLRGDEILGGASLSSVMFPNRDLLRLYASLGKAQQAALLVEPGLDLGSLAPEQRVAAERMLRRNAAFLEDPEACVTLIGTRKRQGKQFEYTFTATANDDLPPMEWKFVTPKYEEPKKPQATKETLEKSPNVKQ